MGSTSLRQAAAIAACACLAVLLCLYPIAGAFIDGHFIPSDADSFYHAHRILDALDHPWAVAQFDAFIAAPNGGWSPVPWAYDTIMALLGSLLAHLSGSPDVLRFLIFVAPLAVIGNTLLVYGITCRLGMSFPWRTLAMLCFVLLPLTQSLHRVGMLDHHFVEQMFVLGTLYLFLGWLNATTERNRAIALGVLLGAAPAFHAGLFILQLPVLACATLFWVQRNALPVRAANGFSAGLVVATLLFLLPSQPFRSGVFTFTLHSGFHAYIALVTAAYIQCFSRLACSSRALTGSLGAGLLLGIPILSELQPAAGFLSGQTYGLAQINEMHSVLAYVREGNFGFVSRNYSALVWIAPLLIGLLLARTWQQRQDTRLVALAVFAVFGFSLLLLQFRLHYFGSLFLFVPLLYLADRLPLAPARKILAPWLAGLGLAVVYLPVLPTLRTPPAPGGSPDYALTAPIYGPMHEICSRAPGVILADSNDGHYLNFHTRCSVMASNIIASEHDARLLEAADRLMRSSVAEVRRDAPYVRYLYVRRNDNPFDSACRELCPENAGLRRELLAETVPSIPGLQLLAELRIPVDAAHSALVARFFVLHPDEQERARAQTLLRTH